MAVRRAGRQETAELRHIQPEIIAPGQRNAVSVRVQPAFAQTLVENRQVAAQVGLG